jgi:hypothetical protein
LIAVSEMLANSTSMQHHSDDGRKILGNVYKLHQTTRRNDPEDSHLHIRRRENLKLHRGIYSAADFKFVV